MEDVEILEEVLQADEPLVLLFDNLEESILCNQLLRVSASRFFLFDPSAQADGQPVLDGHQYNALRVLDFVDKWWVVVLPGWGRAWVQDSDATVTTVAREFGAQLARSMYSLELCSPRARDSTMALLQAIGNHVTKLKLIEGPPEIENWFPGVMESCADLRELHISSSFPYRLTAVTDAIMNNQSTKIERLTFSLEIVTRQDIDQIKTIFAMLAANTHPLATKLRGLTVHARRHMTVSDVDEQAVDRWSFFPSALAMLDMNQTLEFLSIDLKLETTHHYTSSTTWKERFATHHHERLPSTNLISVRAKAAMLSVFTSSTCSRVMREVDRDLISTIFDFAASPRYRHVNVKLPVVLPFSFDVLGADY